MKRKAIFYGRRSGESVQLDTNLWMVPYGSMMTNLMIFFLILFALSSLQQQAMMVTKDQIFVKKLEKFGKISLTADKINVTFSQDIVFPKGSPEVSESFKGVILDVSDYLKNNSGTVIVAGHSDSTPLSGGKHKDNWYLSAERGWGVAAELINRGIDPNRIQIRGYGEYNPVVSNETEEGRAQNRRIEMSIQKTKMKEEQKFIYYKTKDSEDVSVLAKKYLGSENYSQQIRTLNPDKIDAAGKILRDTEILIPFEP